jgi:hypothetical protein
MVPDTGAMLEMSRYAAKNLPLPPIPRADQTVPEQEKGTRPRIPKT